MTTAKTPAMLMRRVQQIIVTYRYTYANEKDLQARLASVLEKAGIEFEREKKFEGDVFDFYLPSKVVIEVKVDGSYPEALRQIDRYCKRDDVAGVLLASAAPWVRQVQKDIGFLHGKPCALAALERQAF